MLLLRREWIILLLRRLLWHLMSGSRRIRGISDSAGDLGFYWSGWLELVWEVRERVAMKDSALGL